MKKAIYLLICLIFLQCGNTQKVTRVNEVTILSDCLTKQEIEGINEGLSIFKELIKNHFEIEKQIDVATYKSFLDDFSRMTLPRDFFASKEAVSYLKRIKQNSLFEILYKKYEEPNVEVEIPITTRNGEEEGDKEDVPDFFVLDGKGKFSKCLLKKSNDKDLKDYLKALDELSDLSPTIKASAMSGILDKVEDDMNVAILSITFGLFYGSVLMFNRF